MKPIKVKLTLIKPYWRNPRNNEAAVKALVESIGEFGYTNPIVVDAKNVILAGHARYQALMRLGWTEAEVIKVTTLTEEQCRRFRIADNKAGELSEWDMDKLKIEIAELGFEAVSFFFDSDQWRTVLEIKDLSAEKKANEEELKAAHAAHEKKESETIDLLCPHCLEEVAFTKEQLREYVRSALPETGPAEE